MSNPSRACSSVSPWRIAAVGGALGFIVYLLPVARERPAAEPVHDSQAVREPTLARSLPARESSLVSAQSADDDFAAPAPRVPDDPRDFDLAQPLPAASQARTDAPPASPSELHLMQHPRPSTAP